MIAVQHHQAGRLQAAEQIYRQILAMEPDHAHVLHLLGVLAHQVGRRDVAAELIERAVRIDGAEPAFHNSLGISLNDRGRVQEAIACYERALELDPQNSEALNNLGSAWQEQAELARAIDCYRRAIALNSENAESHNNLGNALRDSGRSEDAIASYERALQISPDYAKAHYNLGNALRAHGDYARATECFRRAISLNPDLAEAHINLGNVLCDTGRFIEAIESYRRALLLKPDDIGAQRSLGGALQHDGQIPEAILHYRKILELQPGIAEVCHNLGAALESQGRIAEAIDCYRRALELNPCLPSTLGVLIHDLQQICAWDDLPALARRAIDSLESDGRGGLIDPLCLLGLSSPPATPAQQLACGQQWSHLHGTAAVPREPTPTPVNKTSPRLTIGYLSADFRVHPVAYQIANLLEQHDRSRFSVHGYSYGPGDRSPIRERLVQAVDRFVDIKDAAFADAARQITADGVDILIDLTGYTRLFRPQILALRPAPIQVGYLGFPATMGAPFMDYVLVDDFVVPHGQQPYFSEKLVHLPGCYMAQDSRREISPEAPSRAACALPETGFVFCSFNNSFKINQEMFSIWMDLLREIPGSVLWLSAGKPPVAADNLRAAAERNGIAAERLIFAPRLPLMSDHLARYRRADLFLDTFPYNAHSTASDALWAGCPVLTYAGTTFASRVAGSLLRAIGLPELITSSMDEYREMALRLARDADLLADLRTRLQSNHESHPLFDTVQFARHIEQAFSTMWQIHSTGKEPRAFEVSASGTG